MNFIKRTKKDIKDNFLIELLKDRGFEIEENFEKFFSPTHQNELPSVFLDNIQEGAELLKKHILNNSKIYLIVDSDVDGFTSSALIYNYLTTCPFYQNYNFSIEYHIPEGKEHGLRTLMSCFEPEKKYDLIIIPDAGSNDYNEHKRLKELGYDILVLDHHIADFYSEDAIVINNQLSKDYSNKQLSGVGVVYKFIEFFHELWKADYELFNETFDVEQFLDIVALGEISDMMEMTTLENRYICDFGLANLTNHFFKELVEKQSYSIGDTLTQIGVAFYVTPLINSLIRVGSNIEKERLFEAFINPMKEVPSTKRGEKGKFETVSTQAVRNCVNAKARQKRELDKAAEVLKIQIANDCLDENKILIVSADELNVTNTLTGLCAMNISSAYKKPVILGRTCTDGTFKGSIRGRGESELKDFRKFLLDSNLVDWVQGHANAAGISIKTSNIKKLIDYSNKELKDIDFNEGFYEVDFVENGNCSYLSDIIFNLDEGKFLWGQGCEEPTLAITNITVKKSDINIIGTYKDTIRFTFNGITYIKFKAKELIEDYFENGFSSSNSKLNITLIGRGNINSWGGRQTPQILIEDIEMKEIDDNDF